MIFPAKLNQKWGLRHHGIGWLVEPEHDCVMAPRCGVVPVCQEGMWGWMDLRQHWICQPKFEAIGDILPGFVSTKTEQGWGLSAITGETIIAHKHVWLEAPDRGGLVYGRVDARTFVFYDLVGSEAARLSAHSLYYSGDRRLLVRGDWKDPDETDQGGDDGDPVGERLHEYHYVNLAGEKTIPASFDEAYPFVSGIAQIRDGDGWAMINPGGDHVIDGDDHEGFRPTPGASFQEGMLAIHRRQRHRGGHVRCIDIRGSILWEEPLFHVGGYSEGLAIAANLGEERYGWIDRRGKFVIPPQFEFATSFADGIAMGSDEDQEVYLDSNGTILWRHAV